MPLVYKSLQLSTNIKLVVTIINNSQDEGYYTVPTLKLNQVETVLMFKLHLTWTPKNFNHPHTFGILVNAWINLEAEARPEADLI